MSDVMEIVQNEDGTFSAYDDTYDIVIHCETEAEQKKAIDLMNSNRWIPVDERLPEPDKYIAISLDNCDIPAIGRYTVDNEGGGTFRVGNQDESFLEIGLFVNAWMSLPERYEEDKIIDVTIKFVKGSGVE